MSSIFVITLSDIVGLIFFGFFVLFFAGCLIALKIQQRKYRRKK
jgi:hypothetical protein